MNILEDQKKHVESEKENNNSDIVLDNVSNSAK